MFDSAFIISLSPIEGAYHSAVLKRLKKIGEAYEQFNKESD